MKPDAESQAFLCMGAADRARLAELRPVLERHADVLSAAFWRHQLSLVPARELFPDAASLEQAR